MDATRQRLFVLLALAISGGAVAQTAEYLLPAHQKDTPISHHSAYSLHYSEQHEQAVWVAYTVNRTRLAGLVGRTDDYRPDLSISTGSAALADYRGSGLDRGHLAPAAVMKWSLQAMSESFYLSNMSPQLPGFNRGIWRRLEEQVRQWAWEHEELHVVTGPVLTDDLPTIGPNQVSVPNYFYKVILDYEEPDLKAIGFVLPNRASRNLLSSHAVSVDSVEHLTGIDFYPELSDDLEERLESTNDIARWLPGDKVGVVPAVPSPSEETTVYSTKTGSKYHQAGCGYLKSSKVAISIDDAKKQGLMACSVCRP